MKVCLQWVYVGQQKVKSICPRQRRRHMVTVTLPQLCLLAFLLATKEGTCRVKQQALIIYSINRTGREIRCPFLWMKKKVKHLWTDINQLAPVRLQGWQRLCQHQPGTCGRGRSPLWPLPAVLFPVLWSAPSRGSNYPLKFISAATGGPPGLDCVCLANW